MLNISENKIKTPSEFTEFQSFEMVKESKFTKMSVFFTFAGVISILVFMFLPWTQNISAKGTVTTLSPEQRPQAIQSVISGKIDSWHVKEGDFVEKGDTIVTLTEVKTEYFDPELLERTTEQINAKGQSVISYGQKVNALEQQYSALKGTLKYKLEEIKNEIEQKKSKIQIETVNLNTFENNKKISENIYSRSKDLYDKGLKSLSDLQDKELKLQGAQNKVAVQKNKVFIIKNELSNLYVKFSVVQNDYQDKLSKSQSDKQSALSQKFESSVDVSKLKNQYSNYNERLKLQQVTAPQSGYITKTIKKGIGEVMKEGGDVVTIMPGKYDLAVEVFIKPQDTPLIKLGDAVNIRFDGWPAIVISGWPRASTGIFKGNIVAIEQFISNNGLYRIIISPNEKEKIWPKKLKIGTGINSFILLKNVPIWYEIWRQLNGFPADYYREKLDAENPGKKES